MLFHYNEDMFSKINISSLKRNPLKDIFVKTSHQKVLSYFLAHPGRRFYGAEISRETGISTGQVSSVLNCLLKAGLVEKDRRGRTELYTIHAEKPALRIYKVLNTVVSIEPLIERLSEVSRRIILYGSCAKGVNVEESDLDILVVSSKRKAVLGLISEFPATAYYGFAEIKPVIKTPAEWAALEDKSPVFYNEVQNGILLYEKEIDESRL